VSVSDTPITAVAFTNANWSEAGATLSQPVTRTSSISYTLAGGSTPGSIRVDLTPPGGIALGSLAVYLKSGAISGASETFQTGNSGLDDMG
jgi:hypothetical protein